MGEIVLILFDLHADAPFFGVVIVEAVAEVFAPAQACAAVGDEEPVGRGGNGRDVFFFQESEGGGAVGVVDAVEDDHVTVVLQGGYGTRVPLQFVCRIFGDGRMDVDYHTRETNLRAESMSELGIAFDLADDVMRVSWERDAPYARYPEGHIARATGTADRVCAEALEAGYGALPTWPWEHDMFDAYLSEPDDGRWRVATSDFKAMREHIRRYTVGFEEGRAHVSALSDGRAAARVELSGVHPRLVINQQWWYPQLAWGNNCGRPVQLVEGTGRGEATIRVDREN